MINNIFKIKLFSGIAIATGLFVAVANLAESWSQQHMTNNDVFLYVILFSITIAFILSHSHHPERLREITKIGKVSYKLKHAHFITAILFTCIGIFGVNHSSKLIETLHLVFTASAILCGYITIILYPNSKRGHAWANISMAVGGFGFLAGYKFGIYSIAWAEVIAGFPMVIFMWVTLKQLKKVK